jgi:hypothetical protein
MRPIYVFTTIAFIAYFFITLGKAKNKLHAVGQYAPQFFTLIACKICQFISSLVLIWKTLPAFEVRAAWIMLICGLINSLNTSRVIVCSLTKVEYVDSA